jgi:serine/threonine protein kinase/Tol biopolymer transport system component
VAFTRGLKIGPYEIVGLIGAGGMGEVYRARDAQLGRDVALKVLPDPFAQDTDRMARFGREAKLLASLDHANIAAIYGLEDAGETRALVMQLVDGPTLGERIAQGPMPIASVVAIAKQIAEALEYAHEKGIVHRDLKPANVKVGANDTVKILDFGLAKAVGANPSVADSKATVGRMTTEQGTWFGTPAYMPPEQARAQSVDRRADIWAFGCILYEMLTGKTAFAGDTTTDTLAAVIRGEPDWSLLPAETPPSLRALVRRCLQKDARQRLRDVGDARIALEDLLAGRSPDADGPSPVRTSRLGSAAFAVGLGFVTLTIGVVATWMLKPSPEAPRPVVRFTIDLPRGQHLATTGISALALSADGSLLAYVATARADAPQQIFVRAMTSGETRAVAGTEGATNPVFSRDSQWLGFFAGGKLKKVLASGGVAQPLADAIAPGAASWGSRGTIVFSPEAGGKLYLLPEQGGAIRPLTDVEAADAGSFAPEFLPDGEAVIFARFSPSPAILVQPSKGTARMLIDGPTVTKPRYVSSGHLIYAQSGNLMAVPFDAQRFDVRGSAVPVVSSVLQSPQVVPPAEYSVSDTGTLVYVSGAAQSLKSALVWVDRSGAEAPLDAPVRNYDQPRLSPDGGRIALNLNDNASAELWMYDFNHGGLTRFPLEGSINGEPSWTPDGTRIAYFSNREGRGRTFWQLADGGGSVERLTSGEIELPFSWSPDGQILATVDASKNPAIWLLHIADRKLERFPPDASAFNDGPQFSPDGHWIAYVSLEQGRRQIYVQPYPGPGGKRQIPTDDGNEPLWNPNGRELFYRTGDKLMAVDIRTEPTFSIGAPHELFERHYLRNADGYARPNYDVARDGQRFLMLRPVEERSGGPTQIEVVLNWTEELKRLVAVGKR